MSSVGSFVHGGGGFLALSWVRERWRRSFERFRLVGLIQLIFAERVKTFVRSIVNDAPSDRWFRDDTGYHRIANGRPHK